MRRKEDKNMRSTKTQMMEGIEATESKIVGHNTVAYTKPDGTRVVRLHHTDILEFTKDGRTIFNSGGWKTMTTKEQINALQKVATIIKDKGLWYLTTNRNPYQNKDSRVPFFDGITIKDGKVVKPRKLAHKKEEYLLKQIHAYCKKLKELKELPTPNGGDCWHCSFQTDDGRTMGDLSGSDHLKSHLKEKYIHGSLIWNALKWAGYQYPALMVDHRDSVVRAVKRYFKSQLGLVI